jgi:hypothetical protein
MWLPSEAFALREKTKCLVKDYTENLKMVFENNLQWLFRLKEHSVCFQQRLDCFARTRKVQVVAVNVVVNHPSEP